MTDFFEQAEFFMVPPPNKVVTNLPDNVNVVETKDNVLDLSQLENKGDLPVIDASIMGDDYKLVTTNITTTPVTTGATSTINTNAYSALVEELAGKFETEIPADTKFESADDVINFFSNEIIEKKVKEGIDGRLSTVGPKAKLFMDLREYIGDDERTIAVIDDLEYYNSISDEMISKSEDLQKEFITNMLTLKGTSKEKIEEELTDIEALGKLDSKALEAKKFVIKAGEVFIEKSKQKKAETDKLKSDEFAKMLESLDKTESLSEMKITKEMREKVKESISKAVYKDKAGKTYNDIANKQRLYSSEFEKAINYMNVLGLFTFEKDGTWKPDFSKLSTLTSNKIARKLDEAIVESQRFSKVGGESKATEDLATILAQL